MSLADLGTIAGTLVAGIYPITQALKTQIKNLEAKKFDRVGYFILGMIIAILNTYLLKYSNIFDFQTLKQLNVIDTLLLGTYVGLIATGGKDIVSSFVKGKELGLSLKEQLSKLSAEDVSNVAFDVLQDKGVVFGDDINDQRGNNSPSIDEIDEFSEEE